LAVCWEEEEEGVVFLFTVRQSPAEVVVKVAD
jgi:hypothetical protein